MQTSTENSPKTLLSEKEYSPMAIIKFGGGVAGIRGTIAGNTFSANKGGAFAKSWSKGPNPRSIAQTDQRRTLSYYAKLWASIDAGDKADWDTFGADPAQRQTNALGDPYYLSGFQWFLKVNTTLFNAPLSPRLTYPTSAYPTIPTLTSLTCTSGASPDAIIVWPADEFLGFYATVQVALAQNAGATVPPYRPRMLFSAFEPNSTGYNWGTPVSALLGNPSIGSKLFLVMYRLTTDGLRSAAANITDVFT